jgi:hypothetical protein
MNEFVVGCRVTRGANARFGAGEYGADIREFGFAVERSAQADSSPQVLRTTK